MSDEAKLLPCPFCGSSSIDATGWSTLPQYAKTPEERSGPACDDCGASADSVARWNTRPLSAPGRTETGKLSTKDMAEFEYLAATFIQGRRVGLMRRVVAALRAQPVADDGDAPRLPTDEEIETAARALYVLHHSPNPDWPMGIDRNGYHQQPFVSYVPGWKWFHERDARVALTAALSPPAPAQGGGEP